MEVWNAISERDRLEIYEDVLFFLSKKEKVTFEFIFSLVIHELVYLLVKKCCKQCSSAYCSGTVEMLTAGEESVGRAWRAK